MSYIIRWNRPLSEGLSALPLESACYMGGERDHLDRGINEEAIGFKIMEADGNTLVSGCFYGDDRDRDWPLHSARIYARCSEVHPTKLVYDDGERFVWNSEWNDVEKV